MIDLRTVVATVDFSPASAAVARHAADLAARAEAALHLVHADVLFHASGDGVPQAVPSGHLRLRLERFAADTLGPDHGATVRVERHVAVPTALLRYAQVVQADLMVIGSHGRGRLARMLLGSVAEAVVAASLCPVLTLPEGRVAPNSGAPILVAVDFSERSRDALHAGATLATLTGAPLELVHVVRGSGPYPGAAPGLFSLWDVDPAAADTARGRLLRFAAGTPPAQVHVALGSPGRVLPALAAERGAGALVIGTHGRGDLVRSILGSVAQAALRRAPCPVLSVARPRLAAPAVVRSALASTSS